MVVDVVVVTVLEGRKPEIVLLIFFMYTGDVTLSKPRFIEVPSHQAVKFSQRAVFYCRASGNPQPTIQWYKDGVLLQGRIGPSLEFVHTTTSDRGFYSCVVTNSEGELRSQPAVLFLTDIKDYIVPLKLTIPNVGRFQDVPSGNISEVHDAISVYVAVLEGLLTRTVVDTLEGSFFIHRIGLYGGSTTTAVVQE